MKLDKLTFAKLVAHCVSNGMSAGEWEVNQLDMICDVNLPEPAVIQPSAEDIDKLMFMMMQGTDKIEAIKMYHKLTGFGLKKSKDAVEKYWVSKRID